MFKRITNTYNYYFPATGTPPVRDNESSASSTTDNSLALATIPVARREMRATSSSWRMPSWFSKLLWQSSNAPQLEAAPAAEMQQPLNFTLPRGISTSQADIRRLLTPSVFQRILNEGQLSFIPLPQFDTPGSPPIFLARFFGVSALSRFIRQADGSEALQIGTFIFPFEAERQQPRLTIEELEDNGDELAAEEVEAQAASDVDSTIDVDEVREEAPETEDAQDVAPLQTNPSRAERIAAYLGSWAPAWLTASSNRTPDEELNEETEVEETDSERDFDSEFSYSDGSDSSDELEETLPNPDEETVPSLTAEERGVEEADAYRESDSEHSIDDVVVPPQTNPSRAQRLAAYLGSWAPAWLTSSSNRTPDEELNEETDSERDFDSEFSYSDSSDSSDELEETLPNPDEDTVTFLTPEERGVEEADADRESDSEHSIDDVVVPPQTNPSRAQRLAAYLGSWLPTWPASSSIDSPVDEPESDESADAALNPENVMQLSLLTPRQGDPAVGEEELQEETSDIDEETQDVPPPPTNISLASRLAAYLGTWIPTWPASSSNRTTAADAGDEESHSARDVDSALGDEDDFPEQNDIPQEEILRSLQNRFVLQGLINDGHFTINPVPVMGSTVHPSNYQIILFGTEITATVVTRSNGRQVLRLGNIEIPFQDIYFALRQQGDESNEARAPIVDIAPPAASIPAPVTLVDEEEDDEPDLFIDRAELPKFADSLAELTRNIRKIRDPEIQQQTMDIQRKLQALQQQGDAPEKLALFTHVTNQLLSAKPGAERKAIASQYKQLAEQAQTSHSPLMQALGIAMILLGIMVTVISALYIPIMPLIGAAGVVGGATLLAGGIGLFAHACPRKNDAEALMTKLATRIEDEESGLLTNDIDSPRVTA